MSVTGTTLRVLDVTATLAALAVSLMALAQWAQFALGGFAGPRPMATALAWSVVALVFWVPVFGIDKLQTRLADSNEV